MRTMPSFFLRKVTSTHEVPLPAGFRCPTGTLSWVTPSLGPVIKDKPLPMNIAACSVPRPDSDSHLTVCQPCARHFLRHTPLPGGVHHHPLGAGNESTGQLRCLLSRTASKAQCWLVARALTTWACTPLGIYRILMLSPGHSPRRRAWVSPPLRTQAVRPRDLSQVSQLPSGGAPIQGGA